MTSILRRLFDGEISPSEYAAPRTGLYRKLLTDEKNAKDILREMLTRESNRWIIEHMLGKGIRVDPQDYGSLKACVERGFTKLGTRLLDLGVDFDGFRQQVEGQDLLTGTETFRSLAEHWDDMHPPEVEQEQPQEQSM